MLLLLLLALTCLSVSCLLFGGVKFVSLSLLLPLSLYLATPVDDVASSTISGSSSFSSSSSD